MQNLGQGRGGEEALARVSAQGEETNCPKINIFFLNKCLLTNTDTLSLECRKKKIIEEGVIYQKYSNKILQKIVCYMQSKY